ncbi:MAG: hypothetical protein JXB85_11795 [Anaerolineales bacterium]|nr:hypothetical protein [Anaerolineales bacterium]
MSIKSKTQPGQALILIVLAIVGLVAMVALAVDGGTAFANRRNSQNAADAASLAGALANSNNQNWRDAALGSALANGFGYEVTTVNVPPGAGCDGTSSIYAGDPEYVQVIIRTTSEMAFGPVIGMDEIENCVEAIARGRPATYGNYFAGTAMVATKSTGNHTFLLNGGAQVITHDSGIFVNSSGSSALFMNGGADITMDTNGSVVGSWGYNGSASLSPGMTTGVPQMTIDDETFMAVPPRPTPPGCASNGSATTSGSTMNFTPGNFSNIVINGGMTANFAPGVYCLNGNFNLNGSATLNANTGRVIFVTQNQNITFNGGTILNFDDFEVYTNNGTWTLNGSNTFNTSRLRFIASGSGQWIVNGGSTVTSNDAFFYLTSGNITWNGSSNINLHAPPPGDQFAGLLIYMPWSTNTSNVIFNGGSNINITGTYLAPHCPMTFNGSVDADAMHSQIIAYTILVNGGTTIDVTYNPAEQFGPPQPPIVELVR